MGKWEREIGLIQGREVNKGHVQSNPVKARVWERRLLYSMCAFQGKAFPSNKHNSVLQVW